MMKRIALIVALIAAPALAVEPDEMLVDPALEARAQALDDELRCVKCQSENIASSNADWARDARLLVRQLITEGKSDAEVIDFFVERYGEYVRMTPSTRGANLALWLAGPAMLIFAAFAAIAFVRGRAAAQPEGGDRLSEEEQARLRQILDE